MSKKESDENREVSRRSGMAYAAVLSIFFAVLTCMGLGYALDQWLGTGYWMITGIIVGSVVGFYQFIRIMMKIK